MISDDEQHRIEGLVKDFRSLRGIPDDLCPDMPDLLDRMKLRGTRGIAVLRRRQRWRDGIVRKLSGSPGFDSGDYDAAHAQMLQNAARWNA